MNAVPRVFEVETGRIGGNIILNLSGVAGVMIFRSYPETDDSVGCICYYHLLHILDYISASAPNLFVTISHRLAHIGLGSVPGTIQLWYGLVTSLIHLSIRH